MSAPQSEQDARRWVREHWADLITNADMGAVADMANDHLDAVWSDECKRIARRLAPTTPHQHGAGNGAQKD